jgi:hypothetical protein
MLIALTGALAGLFHVLSGPDHLAAVAPLAAADRGRGWLAGWTWGIGHAAGVVVVAAAATLLRDLLPPIEVLSAWGERIVGVALIGIGIWALRRSLRIETAPHAHGALSHEHLHVKAGPAWARRLGHAHASFYMGILHGVAGSSHFFGVLPALALPTKTAAFVYIGAFGVGTVVAMTAFAAAVGSAGLRLHRGTVGYRRLMMSTSVLALAVGGWWLFVGGA